MSDYIVSLIRTWVPVGVGAVLTWLAAKAGIVVDEDTGKGAMLVATALMIAAWYALARAVEKAFPQLGSVLVALGVSKAPVYPVKVIPGRVEPPRG
ncbi:hypothetical protein [Actinomadura litoris]|uniref:hypothetical protein n=1 Tax=Actinomadura litoris TaxID=2678616 RepID=UPI001C12BADD|nr:hypothetical protein [Actinomadura litoris]